LSVGGEASAERWKEEQPLGLWAFLGSGESLVAGAGAVGSLARPSSQIRDPSARQEKRPDPKGPGLFR